MKKSGRKRTMRSLPDCNHICIGPVSWWRPVFYCGCRSSRIVEFYSFSDRETEASFLPCSRSSMFYPLFLRQYKQEKGAEMKWLMKQKIEGRLKKKSRSSPAAKRMRKAVLMVK